MRSGRSSLTDVPGVRVGHATARGAATGVTAVVFRHAVPTVMELRGPAACTYDAAPLSVDATWGVRWGVFFTGGSSYGLDAGGGLREAILAGGGGHRAFPGSMRIAPVAGAALFDLRGGMHRLPDYRALGRQAGRDASSRVPAEGRVGAGTGATLGKYLGLEFSAPGGVASASVGVRGGATVGALVVVNAVGAIRDPDTGAWLAAARDARGRLVPPTPRTRADDGGTSLAAVVTDAPADRWMLRRLAVAALSGIARAIQPVHCAGEGDLAFAASTGAEGRLPLGRERIRRADELGAAAERASAEAVVRVAATSVA